MDTLRMFNLEIRNARQIYTTAVLTMTAAGQHAVTAVPGKKGAGLPEFQTAAHSGRYVHVALLNVTNVMCVWHAAAPAIVAPVKQPVLDWKQPEPPKPNRLGVPNRLFHLDWEEGVFTPKAEPGKKIPFLKATVQYQGDWDAIGETHVSVIATRYPKSFQVRILVREVDGNPMDLEGEVPMSMTRSILAFKGTVAEFEQDFDAIRRRIEKQVDNVGYRPEKGGSEWTPYYNAWDSDIRSYNTDDDDDFDDDDSAYGDGWDEFGSLHDMDI